MATLSGAVSSGQIRSKATGSCLITIRHWLWDYATIPTLGNCNPTKESSWLLGADNTLRNEASGCVEVSTNAGPPSTVWVKPLSHGRQAVLVINGADIAQQIDLDFRELDLRSTVWSTRSVWDKKDLGAVQQFSTTLGPHDSALLVLSPAAIDGAVTV